MRSAAKLEATSRCCRIVQFDRQGELNFFKQAAVGPFVFVCGGPIFLAGHPPPILGIFPDLAVSKFIAVFLILTFPLDVFRFGLGTLPTASAIRSSH